MELDEELWKALHACKDEIFTLKQDIATLRSNLRFIRYLLYIAIAVGIVRLPFELGAL